LPKEQDQREKGQSCDMESKTEPSIFEAMLNEENESVLAG
jgi:hypothetical protein